MRACATMVVLMLVALVTGGCFQVERVVTVRPDGSGTLEESVRFSKKMLQGFTQAFAPEGEQPAGQAGQTAPPEQSAPDLYDEQSLQKAAATMGSGVSYQTSQRISDDNFTGYRVVYRFTDINQLRMDKGLPSPSKKQAQPAPSAAEQGGMFSFVPAAAGKPALLTLQNRGAQSQPAPATGAAPPPAAPAEPPAPAPGAAPAEPQQQELELLKMMLDGMSFKIVVAVDGTIVETNATHREASRITLADVDFSKLLSLSEQDMARLNAVKEQDLPAAMAALKEIPGVKVDLNETVQVRFK